VATGGSPSRAAATRLVSPKENRGGIQGRRPAAQRYEDGPLFADFDEERYRRESLARAESTRDLLDTIVAVHAQLGRLLEILPDAEWAREGRHPSLGVMSIEFLARRIGEHAEEHAAQITAATRAGSGAEAT
jgi:hypothetical protein